MDDPPRQNDATRDVGDDATVGSEGRSKLGRPRWVKVSLIVVLAVVVLVVVLAFTGVFGGEHVPGPPAGGH
jgi:hypothetical protein